MDELQVVTQTLYATIQRNAKQMQNYEVEIVNLTADIVRLKAEVEEKNNEIEVLREHVNKLTSPQTSKEKSDK
jgi:predicted RNase H-like nuclease (RuvC/YqgF family)